MNSVVDMIQAKLLADRRLAKPLKQLWLRFIALIALCLAVMGAMLWPASPQNLGIDNRLVTSGALEAWRNGNLIVLVRHAERCDRSSNPCLGPPDGLTRSGGMVATAVGAAFQTLGMSHSDVLSSPATRTLQTSQFMFDHARVLPDRLTLCGPALAHDLPARKAAGRNLLLVTHSECIADLERVLGYPHADGAEYGSSLFVQVGNHGKLKVLGVLNSQDWASAFGHL
ncbi:histidine phosphatase family protein [Pseudomonas sp. LG1D9]|uniref:lipopolysaccharide core heptose(II)-phosphate phosphatase PmrG n=1 Tax=Pseudomonas sp. LG1D9 TaxID=2083054 RepID=UPI0021146B4B|nr:histidine phosphatase family protein [Pseudomonas sp. LG1D9]